jgi:SecY interacting protein Syd
MNKSALALDSLLTRYENLYKDTNKLGLPSLCLEEPWPSPCIIETTAETVDDLTTKTNEQTHFWQHTVKNMDNIFVDLERALELDFHPDIHTFYATFWSNGIRVEHSDVDFALIQTWNEEDQENLKENILGHCFAKMKARLPLTVFIGCTDSNEIISIENESGSIVLERPGRKAHKILAQNLESFLLELNPTTEPYD